MYAAEEGICIEMLAIKEGYRFEYQGDCVQPVWYKTLEKTIYNFFTRLERSCADYQLNRKKSDR